MKTTSYYPIQCTRYYWKPGSPILYIPLKPILAVSQI